MTINTYKLNFIGVVSFVWSGINSRYCLSSGHVNTFIGSAVVEDSEYFRTDDFRLTIFRRFVIKTIIFVWSSWNVIEHELAEFFAESLFSH